MKNNKTDYTSIPGTPDWLRGRRFSKTDVEHILVHISIQYGYEEILSHFSEETLQEELIRRSPLVKALEEL